MANFPTKTTGSQLLTLDDKQLLTYNNPTNYYVDHTSSLVLAISPDSNDTSIVDKSNNPHVVNLIATAALSKVTSPFSDTQAILFDGNSDYLSIPNSTDFQFGSSDCTIETWIYIGASQGSEATVIAKHEADVSGGWALTVSGTTFKIYYNIRDW